LFPHRNGSVLDVACGKVASTRLLLCNYDPCNVTGINISEKQLATGREMAPGCRSLKMDATHLTFPDNSIDNVLCVEAAFHFNTRAVIAAAMPAVIDRNDLVMISRSRVQGPARSN
jgi:ubiquinone/menaquinone biosynthesis C-methylase UbiE